MRAKYIGILLLAGVLLAAGAPLIQSQTGTPPRSVTVKVLVPETDAGVAINGLVFKGDGGARVHKIKTIDDAITVSAFWEPNNYTKITRKKRVAIKDDGEVVVDLRKATDIKDDIVVRFVPTPDDVVAAMCKLAKVDKNDIVYDLGCGDGRMVITAVKDFGAKRGVGVDIDAKLVVKCKQAAKDAGVADKVKFREGDVLKVDDLSDATVVLLYMGDDINARLKPILQKTLKPGSRVVSHRFLMGDDWKPDKTETIQSDAGYPCDIHLWVIKARDQE